MTNSEAPLLTIIIPTRNRPSYAIVAVQNILRIKSTSIEIIVQDNSDTHELAGLISERIQDVRVKYNHTPTPLSFIANFNTAIDLATGEYICVIGDDDGVNPEIIEATYWAKQNDISSLKPTTCANYLWPGTGVPSSLFTKVPQDSGLLIIDYYSGKLRRINPREELSKLVRRGGQDYLKTELPKLYHGIIRRSCLEKVQETAGAYFGGLSPDIYAAVAIACTSGKMVSFDYPLTLPGVCSASGSAHTATGKHVGNIEEAPHLKHRGSYKWSDLVPKYYSPVTIWADSAIAALKDMGEDALLKDFNEPYLAACCSVSDKKYQNLIIRHLRRRLQLSKASTSLGMTRYAMYVLIRPIQKLCWRIRRRIMVMMLRNRFSYIYDVNNINEASDAMTNHINASGHNVEQYIKNNKTSLI